MEVNESDEAKFLQPDLGDSHGNMRLAGANEDADLEHINSTETLLDDLLKRVKNDDIPVWFGKETRNDQADDNGNNSKFDSKQSVEAELPKSMFHLSDNMKKDLSMLAFPAKPRSRKKGIISSRVTTNSRITIAEALEKAKDARKSISNLNNFSNKLDNTEQDISNLPSQYNSSDTVVDKINREPQDVMKLSVHSDILDEGKKIMKTLDTAVGGKGVAEGSLPSEAAVTEAASCSEGKTVSMAGRGKSTGTARTQMSRRMWELLKFTFVHEHFPSSVHMARLAKMMGLPWSQVRNWFTDQRVDNKKAGLFLRDRPLIDCPYCNVILETEAEQKSHLFAIQHVKRILGPEYCGGGTSESIKWKKLPKTVNAVSKVSGARILAVGFSAEDSKKKAAAPSVQEKKTMEAAVEEVPHSKELKKLWTKAMLLPEEKEQPAAEWKPVRSNLEENSENNCKSYKQEKKEIILNLTGQEGKEKVSKLNHQENMYEGKVVVNSRVVSIPVNVGDMNPGSINDNFHVTLSNATPMTTSNMVGQSTYGSVPVNTNSVSGVMPGDPRVKKQQQYRDVSVISDPEASRKLSMGGLLIESPVESQRPTSVASDAPRKAFRATFPSSVKPKSRHASYAGSSSISKQESEFFKSSALASQFMQDIELKQEHESDETWNCKNNITLYRGDGSDGQGKCEMAVINANKQPFAISQSPALCRPRSPQLVKRSSSMYQSQTTKSGIRSAVNKIPRAAGERRQVKFRTQPLGSVLRSNKTRSAHEGSIIVGYQCPNCSKVYQTEWLMIKHSVTHFKYHCDICYKVYPNENMMKVHLLDHLSGAYEDEKYYCQFSCKICHSLKCGCCEQTYCKPQDLPRIFFRPQKARRSKKGFISKLNSGPNDHLKISLSSYKKLLVSDSLGLPIKENTEGLTSPKSTLTDLQKVILLKDAQKSAVVGDAEISTFVVREAQPSNTSAEMPRLHHKERENQEFLTGETSHAGLSKDKGSDTAAGVSSDQLGVRSDISAFKEDLITEKQKQLNWNEIKTKWAFSYKSNVNSLPDSSGLPKPTQGRRGGKRGGRRKQTTKLSSNFTYEDTDYYYMCEICDASFSSKSELSEHMFLHRLKSRSRRGEKRGISSVIVEKEMSKKMKIHELEDRAGTETVVGSPTNHSCELCHYTFTTAADYKTHKALAHKEPETADASPQSIEVFRCNYCDKIYRRRRELKRHLKRDCMSAPPSLKGILSGLSCSTNLIEDSHYTTVKIDFDDKSDAISKSVGKGAKGPIVCKYCLAVTKREAEMKRHIWKFCLRVPAEVVKKFMDGASLEELGFKYINDKASTETSTMDISKNTHTQIPGNQKTVKCSSDEMSSGNATHSELGKESSPEKDHPVDGETSVQMELPDTLNSDMYSLQMSPPNEISVQTGTSEESESAKHTVEEKMEMSYIQPVLSEDQSPSIVQSEESKKMYAESEPTENQSPPKHLSEEAKMESSSALDETAQTSASTSPLASPVMQFPIVLPVMTASAKSKRPLVCGYCGIWYFREMAIMKHMKERCIKIPEFEKELLKNNSALCSVPQKAGAGIASENGAVYKMVKVPEHMQNTPVPMPKDVSNEDIKELNINIKAYSENAPAEATVANEQDSLSSSVSPPVNQNRTTSSKRGSRCRRCHEHFSSQEAVLAHSSVHHGPKKGFYKCKLCHARLAKYKQLREHVWEHTNENPYRCHLCEVRYRSSDALVEHLQTQHQYTSINDKNLYKWLPGRHGKYRDIKVKNSSCEEKLDDVDTNLESLAEVMVITDKDICSNTATYLKSKDNENKATKSCCEMNEHLVDSKNTKERSESLQVGSICSKGNSHKNTDPNEPKITHCSSNVITTDSNVVSEDTNVTDHLLESSKFITEENSEKIPCVCESVKIAAVQEESMKNLTVQEESIKYATVQEESMKNLTVQEESIKHAAVQGERENKRPTPQTACFTNSKNKVTVTGEVEAVDAVSVKNVESGLDDTFTGEGLLPLVGNLDSVVETIHLTDKHLL